MRAITGYVIGRQVPTAHALLGVGKVSMMTPAKCRMPDEINESAPVPVLKTTLLLAREALMYMAYITSAKIFKASQFKHSVACSRVRN